MSQSQQERREVMDAALQEQLDMDHRKKMVKDQMKLEYDVQLAMLKAEGKVWEFNKYDGYRDMMKVKTKELQH